MKKDNEYDQIDQRTKYVLDYMCIGHGNLFKKLSSKFSPKQNAFTSVKFVQENIKVFRDNTMDNKVIYLSMMKKYFRSKLLVVKFGHFL